MPTDAFHAIYVLSCLEVLSSIKRAEIEELHWIVNRSQLGLEIAISSFARG